jgi:hypothetical protein
VNESNRDGDLAQVSFSSIPHFWLLTGDHEMQPSIRMCAWAVLLSSNHLCSQYSELLLLLRHHGHHLIPPLLTGGTLSRCPAFPLAIRNTRVDFLSVEQISPNSRRTTKSASHYSSKPLVVRLTPLSVDLPGRLSGS